MMALTSALASTLWTGAFSASETLPPQGQVRLVTAVRGRLGPSARRIAFYEEQFGLCRIFLAAIRQFTRQHARFKHVLSPDELPGLVRGFARFQRADHFLRDLFRIIRVFFEVGFDSVIDDRGHQPLDLA